MKKILAFTLAETLIVMGIIGVVSALTLPNLNSSTGEKEKVAKVKKIYQNLNDAVGRAQAVYGPFNEWFSADGNATLQTTRFTERVTEFMKVSKNCGKNTGCWSTAPLLHSNGEVNVSNNHFQSLQSDKKSNFVLLADGIALAINVSGNYVKFRVDIDGPNKGKTQEGSDIFDFTIASVSIDDTLAPFQLTPSSEPSAWKNNLIINYETAWVIKNDNLDYLKCLDKLNWETKITCK